MPIYEFECKKCGNKFEIVYPTFSDITHEICSNCGYLAKRIVSLNNFHLKGDGWGKDSYSKVKKKED